MPPAKLETLKEIDIIPTIQELHNTIPKYIAYTQASFKKLWASYEGSEETMLEITSEYERSMQKLKNITSKEYDHLKAGKVKELNLAEASTEELFYLIMPLFRVSAFKMMLNKKIVKPQYDKYNLAISVLTIKNHSYSSE